jgi:hypothetical protein
MPTLSIIVTLGFVRQRNLSAPELGDEFDHIAALVGAKGGFELILVDRAWPERWFRVQEALGPLLDRVKYIPPKPSPIIDMGYRAVNVMRNSAAIVTAGDMLAFVDDFLYLDAASADRMIEYFEAHRRLLCPVISADLERAIPEGPPSVFSGHNPGVYACAREHFKMLGCFDENFDGTYGEADTEWQNRLDRLLDSKGYGLRLRERGVKFQRTEHANGDFPQALDYPFGDSGSIKDPQNLRCNRAYFHCISQHRLQHGQIDATRPLSDGELERLKNHRCFEGCGVCNRGDRHQQLQSYRLWPADADVLHKMEAFEANPAAFGCNDPWEHER